MAGRCVGAQERIDRVVEPLCLPSGIPVEAESSLAAQASGFGDRVKDRRRLEPVAERTGVRVWDLFFMEQEYGVWAANGQSQWDLVHERMTPFNHRGLLTALMGVEPVYRQPPYYLAQRRMMEILWADVLAEPFNHPDRSLRRRSQETARRLREIGLESGVGKALSSGVRKLLPS